MSFFNVIYLKDPFFFIFAISLGSIFTVLGYKARQLFIPGRYVKSRSRGLFLSILISNLFFCIVLIGGPIIGGLIFLNASETKLALIAFLPTQFFFLGFLIYSTREYLEKENFSYSERFLNDAFFRSEGLNDKYISYRFERWLLKNILLFSSKQSSPFNYFLFNYIMAPIFFGVYQVLAMLNLWEISREYFKLKSKYCYRRGNFRQLKKVVKLGEAHLKKLQQDESQTLNAAQSLYYMRKGNYGKAFTILQKAVKMWPQNPYFWLYLSHVYWQEDYLNEAIKCNDKVLLIAPTCRLALSRKIQYSLEEILADCRPNSEAIIERVDKKLNQDLTKAREYLINDESPPAALLNSWGIFKLMKEDYENAFDLFSYCAEVHSHTISLLYLGLLSLIGIPTFSTIKSKYFFYKIVHLLDKNKKNKIYKIAEKNLKNRISKVEATNIVFNKRIVLYPFLSDPDLPEEAVTMQREELETIYNFRQKHLDSMSSREFYLKFLHPSYQLNKPLDAIRHAKL
jgi:tetratricopeptide (TPR) repeat protein